MPNFDTIRILLIDDDPGDAELLYRQLEDIPGREIQFHARTDLESGLEALRDTEIDLILIDYLLGAETGLEALAAIKAAGFTQPVVMVTGQGNEQVAVEAMKAGAADYLVKRYTSTDDIQRALLNALSKAELENKIREQQKELEWLAMRDGLTGLFNRRFFMRSLQEELDRAAEGGRPLSLLIMDLDHFKRVNDTYGHLIGDEVLVRTARLLDDTANGASVVGRFGGEEFCVAIRDSELTAACDVAEALRRAIEAQEFKAEDGTDFKVTCSIGAAQVATGSREINPLLRVADEALYKAKAEGRNRVIAGG